MVRPSVASIRIKKITSTGISDTQDLLALEEPMEIRLAFGPVHNRQQKSISVTMRTPGNDFELALGFLYTEGIIRFNDDVSQIRYCTELGRIENNGNIIRVELKADVNVDFQKLQRHFYTTSSCGVCGKVSIDAIAISKELPDSGTLLKVEQQLVSRLPGSLRASQQVFEYTGGLHAAALFDTKGEIMFIREDVGRHNALDKLIGASFSSGMLPLHNYILLLSGRASFELIQKSVMAGIKIIAAIGAPSSLAVETAKKFDVTLIGFLREERFNIYSGEERILCDPMAFGLPKENVKEVL